jgi:hypothetical protein
MAYDSNENINNNVVSDKDANIDIKASEIKDTGVRKRIDYLLEKKRLKELLDDSDDW